MTNDAARRRIWTRCLAIAFVFLATLCAQAELPLKRNASFELNVSTVTWLSFDIAPNGRYFVLEVLGDLYTLPVEGGTAERLTSGLGFDSQPVYSPDGSMIAFISDRSGSENVWVMHSDGSGARELSDAAKDAELMSPSWSPDGSHVIASVGDWKSRVYRVWAYHLAGGKGVRLAPRRVSSSTESHNYTGATYSPDGRYLYHAFKTGGFGYNQQLPLWQVRRLELVSNEHVTLTTAVGSAFRPVLSPDGSKLVYGTRFDTQTGLRMRDLPSGKDEWLVYPVQRDDQESRYTRDLLPKPVFSPEGDVIFYTVDGKLFGMTLASRDTFNIPFEVPLNVDRVERIEFPYRVGLGPVKAQLVRGLEPSPDGSRVAFAALAQIYVYDFETTELIELTSPSRFAAHPTWSPDGRELAFVDWRAKGGHIWRIRARANAKPERVSKEAGFYFDPLWRRDGEAVIALRASAHERAVRASDFYVGVATDLVQVPLNTGIPRLITHAPKLYDPHYGPESDRIYVYEWPGMFAAGDSGLFSLRLDGTDRRKHLEMTGPGIYNSVDGLPAFRARISPDGRHTLLRQASQLYVVKMLGSGAASVEIKVTDCSLPCERLTDVGVDDFAWDASGKRALWSIGHTVFVRDVESAFVTAASNDEPKESKRLAEEHESVRRYEIAVYAPRHEPSGSVVLRNATVLPVAADYAEPLAATDVLILGDRIETIGPALQVPDGSHEIDLTGKFLVPGFVDTHAHVPIYRGVVSGEAWSLLANLAYGMTTIIDVQPSTVDVIEYENLVEAGRMIGPRVLSTGPGIFSDTTFKSEEDALGVLQRYKDHYGVRNLKSYLPGNRKQRQWLLNAARELQLNPTTEGALDLKVDLTHALDGFTGQEHNLPIIGIYDDVIGLMARTRMAYTPTLLVSYGGPFGESHFYTHENPRGDQKLARFTPPAMLEARLLRHPWFHPDTHVFTRHAETAHDILQAGGRVGVGSHGQLQGLGFHWELWALSTGGFSGFEALRAATRHGAEMIGIAQDVGSIEVGKLADLVVLNTNPYEDIRATNDIAMVIANGFVRRGDDLAELWPQQRAANLPVWETTSAKN
ncbi:MAG: amidohydrolase family protein [Gammaproteobacteria bacterium]|nr:amidohydrolase family protein [Gammaproteobacteria bacterium]